MKHLIITLLFLPVLVSAQKCDNYLTVTEPQESQAFKTERAITSKWIRFFSVGDKSLHLKFSNSNTKSTITIQQQTKIALEPKQSIVLGTEIRIAFIFENGEIFIMKFSNSQEFLGTVKRSVSTSRNTIEIPLELNELLKSSPLSRIELKSPFSSYNVDVDKLISKDAENGKKILTVYNCFLNKIKEL